LRLGLGLDPKRKSVNPQAWKDAIGANRVPARLALLPEAKPRWDRIGLSAGGQLGILAVLLLLPRIFPDEMNTALKYTYVELMQPVTEIPVAPEPEPPPPPPPKPPKIKAKVKVPPPKPKPIELEPEPVVPEPVPVKLNPTQPHIFMVLKPETPKVRTVDAKPIDLNPVLEVAKVDFPTTQPKRPKEEVKIENLESGSTAPGTLVSAANKVQTGGFGDPNGIAGPGNPNRAANINQAGSPLLSGGPGNGSGSGGANGMRGTVAEGPNKQALGKGGGNTPVSILDRPHPVYSDEGRTLRIEGDVILDVVFLASGQLQVNSVVSGLGHGLDQAAVQAAKQIHFKPATRDGHPVDFPARVRISFRVAA
jgi:TonB family protein